MSELLELANNAVKERNTKLKSIYPGFKSIADKLDSVTISSDFWVKERENILKAIADGRKQKESMKMSPEKFRQEFTI